MHRLIRNALMDGQYEPGERIRISTVASELGTSITPVREAIFRLVSEGALELKAATSVQVPILSVSQLREIQTVRILLEGVLTERAGEVITERQLSDLERIQEDFIAAAERDAKLASLHNRRFHFALMTIAAQPTIAGVVENMWVMMGSLLKVFHDTVPQRELSKDRHRHYDVLSALREGRPVAAREAMEADIRWGMLLVEWLEEETRKREAAEQSFVGRLSRKAEGSGKAPLPRSKAASARLEV
ncbi:GntR family transcriptional regulator (plasmid) [Roseomonas sp. CCTCC AB2023176]|uniref:GntR family transcriptional regulator n=1 Tax=Roseomonas sp. CCTCC AB2023176 TaxID=3342640 RepID=UPI0035D644A5